MYSLITKKHVVQSFFGLKFEIKNIVNRIKLNNKKIKEFMIFSFKRL